MKKTRTLLMVVLISTLMVGPLLSGMGQAEEDSRPGPTRPVAEQNLDDSGLIRVHEQGVAAVDVTNANLDVTLANDELDVNIVGGGAAAPQAVTAVRRVLLVVDEGQRRVQVTFPAIAVSSILIFNDPVPGDGFGGDEYELSGRSPLTGIAEFPLALDIDGGHGGFTQVNFPQPIPLHGLDLVCFSEVRNCVVQVVLAGF